MKFCQIHLKVLLLISCFAFVPKALAQTDISMPPVGDYVLRFTTTDTGEKEYYSINIWEGTVAGEPNTYKSATTSAQYMENYDAFRITITVFENKITLTDRVDYWASMDGILPFKFHETGFNEVLGRETYFQYMSYTKGFVDGEYTNVSFKNPTGIMYVGLYDGHAILEVELQKEKEDLTDADIEQLKEFIKTISVTYEDVFDTEAENYVFSSPNLMVHLSPGNFVEVSSEMLVPKNWIVEETTLLEATAQQREGKIVLDLFPYEEPYPGEAPERLRISLVGLPEQKLKAATYKEAGRRALAEVVQSPKKLSSKDVTEDMEEYMFGAHCLANFKGGANSGGVVATTYEGLNNEGLPIKALHISAGGFYLACNYIYSAPPERFDENVDFVMDVLKGLSVDFLGPPLER